MLPLQKFAPTGERLVFVFYAPFCSTVKYWLSWLAWQGYFGSTSPATWTSTMQVQMIVCQEWQAPSDLVTGRESSSSPCCCTIQLHARTMHSWAATCEARKTPHSMYATHKNGRLQRGWMHQHGHLIPGCTCTQINSKIKER